MSKADGEALTSDNPHLSEAKKSKNWPLFAAGSSRQVHENLQLISQIRAQFLASETKNSPRAAFGVMQAPQTSDLVAPLVAAGMSPATRRAYRTDLAHFSAWGGVIPATETLVANYLAEHAATLSPATLVRRLAAISTAHTAQGFQSPVCSPLVRATLRGIRRSRGVAQREAKPLLRDDLFLVLDAIGHSLRDQRDRAIILLGFAGGFRRSELVGLDGHDIEAVRQGIVLTLRRSKTDQDARGRRIGIPFGRTRHCPVLALDAWRSATGITDGPIFRPIDRHGRMGAGRLSGEAVSIILQRRLGAAGINPIGYSAHTLRAGLATSAAMAGVSSWKIRAQTGHASDAMLARYVREGELFIANVAGKLL